MFFLFGKSLFVEEIKEREKKEADAAAEEEAQKKAEAEARRAQPPSVPVSQLIPLYSCPRGSGPQGTISQCPCKSTIPATLMSLRLMAAWHNLPVSL